MKLLTLVLALTVASTAFAQRRLNHQAAIEEIANDIEQCEWSLSVAKQKLLDFRAEMGRRNDPIVATTRAKPVFASSECLDVRDESSRAGGIAAQKQAIQTAINNVLAVCRSSGRPESDCDERNIIIEFAPDAADPNFTFVTTARLD